MNIYKTFLYLLSCVQPQRKVTPSEEHVDRAVRYSLKKYGGAYKLLEKYDKIHPKDPAALAKPGAMQKYF